GRHSVCRRGPPDPPDHSTTAMQDLFVAWYHFRPDTRVAERPTPAMAGALTVRVWTIKERIERAAAT
ncbi:MAG TPA: hypothetical protein VHE81_08765, partial [Lacipirellulaceae bacterium]|nr:hypothetical protein [Lacipirellulaceae bacterium]